MKHGNFNLDYSSISTFYSCMEMEWEGDEDEELKSWMTKKEQQRIFDCFSYQQYQKALGAGI